MNHGNEPLSFQSGPECAAGQTGHCLTCADEVETALVLEVDEPNRLALVEWPGGPLEVDLSLLEPEQVWPGDRVLVHGGVALDKVGEV